MIRIFLLSTAIFCYCHISEASGKHPKDSLKITQGLMAGGMLLGGESYLMGKYEYLINNTGLQISATREHEKRKIAFDSSKDKYLRVGYGLTFRYYVPELLKGFFGGAALSSTTANLTTEFRNKQKAKDCALINSGGIELGYRIGGSRKGFIGEVGFRRMYNFNQLQLSTSDNISYSDIDDGISAHSWTLPSGDHSDKFFIGVGYVF